MIGQFQNPLDLIGIFAVYVVVKNLDMKKNECIHHINTVNWFKYHYPELEEDFHHFANERKCSPMQGNLLKRMGVKKGVSDFFLALPLNGKAGKILPSHGLFGVAVFSNSQI